MGALDKNLEALYQATLKVLSREDTRAQTDVLFNRAKETRQSDRALLEYLFFQTPASQTMAPNLQKEASVTKNVEAFFEKVGKSEAQKRYPELLKAAGTASGPAPRPSTTQVRKATPTSVGGATSTRSVLSGGS